MSKHSCPRGTYVHIYISEISLIDSMIHYDIFKTIEMIGLKFGIVTHFVILNRFHDHMRQMGKPERSREHHLVFYDANRKIILERIKIYTHTKTIIGTNIYSKCFFNTAVYFTIDFEAKYTRIFRLKFLTVYFCTCDSLPNKRTDFAEI